LIGACSETVDLSCQAEALGLESTDLAGLGLSEAVDHGLGLSDRLGGIHTLLTGGQLLLQRLDPVAQGVSSDTLGVPIRLCPFLIPPGRIRPHNLGRKCFHLGAQSAGSRPFVGHRMIGFGTRRHQLGVQHVDLRPQRVRPRPFLILGRLGAVRPGFGFVRPFYCQISASIGLTKLD
jgi:hypothetical protein